MNPIAAKQIRDVLDYDKNINTQLVKIEKRQIKRWDEGMENPMAYSQIDAPAVDAAKQVASDLKIMLEKKLSLIFIFDRIRLETPPDLSRNLGEFMSIEEVFRQFNVLAKLYLNPENTIQTKLSIQTEASRLAGVVERIHNKLQEVVRTIVANPSRLNPDTSRQLVQVYNLYDIIYDQLQDGNLYPITDDALLSNRKNIIKKNPALSRIIPPSVPVYPMDEGDDDEEDERSDGKPSSSGESSGDDDDGAPPPTPPAPPAPKRQAKAKPKGKQKPKSGETSSSSGGPGPGGPGPRGPPGALGPLGAPGAPGAHGAPGAPGGSPPGPSSGPSSSSSPSVMGYTGTLGGMILESAGFFFMMFLRFERRASSVIG